MEVSQGTQNNVISGVTTSISTFTTEWQEKTAWILQKQHKVKLAMDTQHHQEMNEHQVNCEDRLDNMQQE